MAWTGHGAELRVIDPDSPDAAAELDKACRSLGFFRIPLDVIDRDVADDAWSDARVFFGMPEEAKRAVVFPETGYPYGYSPFLFERLAASVDGGLTPDLKESLSVGPDCLGPIPETTDPTEQWLRSPSLWPATPETLRTSWSRYYTALADVSRRLLGLMATTLDLPVDYFDSMIDRHTSALRALRYPTLDTRPPADSLRAGAHSDYGTLTILRTDEVPGLEVQMADGRWSAVAPEPDTFVVNLGDSIAQWTNDRWRSTLHRVTTVSRRQRHSIAFFHMANCDAVIECLPTCRVDGQEPHHAPAVAGPWLMEKFSRSVAQEAAE